MSIRTLSPEGVDCEIPHRLGEKNECQQRHWAPNEWIGRFHVDYTRERVSIGTLSPEGSGL